ncbi:MAG: Sulfhydrogenase II, delta chain [Candidatus Berkelbacteria bacterium Licking1014_2]|uniref:Sulfhydrogenase II, delta chain n=1 Tax=Candidatus Berkelbacteria bacterium Licking1014_2 TaxID=2017146 RepID=A0A554LX97_9BACT|nr:MAG: Sulfhydrogenase II, delta chain [Candidatus Berkelbacteria bacterium Licking1014_2]
MKKKVAVFDLTDCEGCELQFLVLKEKLLELGQEVDIVNWRLLGEAQQTTDNRQLTTDNRQQTTDNRQLTTNYDIALVEGTVMTDDDINLLQEIRAKSKTLVALGSCAVNGNIPTLIKREDRAKVVESIYGQNYKARAIGAWPLSHFVKVDMDLPGCPVEVQKLEEFIRRVMGE